MNKEARSVKIVFIYFDLLVEFKIEFVLNIPKHMPPDLKTMQEKVKPI
jgi:hypothetical protein